MSEPALVRLSALLREQGGLLASLLDGDFADVGEPSLGDRNPTRPNARPLGDRPVPNGAGPAQVAAGGPRAREHGEEYELLMEAIYEGYLLHYGTPRVIRPAEADLGLLAGDQLYALGLARLVALGDLAAVAELADVITLTALAHGEDREDLALAVWAAGARAVGWGSTDSHRRAKALIHARDPEALAAMHAAAEPRR